MRIEFTNEANNDISSIYNFISKDCHEIAKKQVAKIKAKALLLENISDLGTALYRGNKKTNLRKLLSKPYIIFHEVFEDYIKIIRVLDGRRDYMRVLFG